jgi:ribonuclease-3
MGGRDKGGRETKKPRKDAKKAVITATTIAPPPEVEVVRRKRKCGEEA